MATSFQAHVHQTFEDSPVSLMGAKWVQDASGTAGNIGLASTPSRRQSWVSNSEKTSILADIVHSLSGQGGKEIVSSKIVAADYPAFVEWISSERMKKLPPEGSSYDKALYWARLLAERLHSFDLAIEQFAGDSHMAFQLAYVHCASLLELGEENSCALMDLFSFFYRISTGIEHLLDHKELFIVSQNVKDQLVLALADLVTVIVGVSTHFHKDMEKRTPAISVVEIYSTFAEPIESLRFRCELASALMWEYQLLNEKFDSRKVHVKAIRRWLEPEDGALANIVDSTIQLAQEREESTCLWLGDTISHFLKGEQQTLAFIGKPGSGKSILASVINDHLRQPLGGIRYKSIFVPINGRIPATTHAWAVAKCILLQLFAANTGNVRLYQTILDAYERCSKTTDIESYENILFKALENAFQVSVVGVREPVLVVDGLDEAICGQKSLLIRLRHATAKAPNLKMIMLAAEEEAASMVDTAVHITPELVFDDVVAASRRVLQNSRAFNQTTEAQRESSIYRIAKAANGSFLWAKLAVKEICDDNPPNAQALAKAIDKLEKGDHSITDMVTRRLGSTIPEEGKTILSWLLAVARPLAISELSALLSVQTNGDSTGERKQDVLNILKHASSLLFCHNDMVYLRHEQLREAITKGLAKDRPTPVKDGHIDLSRRLLLYIKQKVVNGREPSKAPVDPQVSSDLVKRHDLLDFALRYWVSHTEKAFGFTTEQEVEIAAQELSPVLPESPIVISLAAYIWENKPTPMLVSLYSIQSRLYQQALTTSRPVTLQAVLSQAIFHQQTEVTTSSITANMFYNAATICQEVLSATHTLTMQIAQEYLHITTNQVSESWTDTMHCREKMFWLLFKGYEINYGSTSNMTYTLLAQILNHYELLKDERMKWKVKNIMNKPSRPDDRPSNGSLTVQVIGPKDPEDMPQLSLDGGVNDLPIQDSFDFYHLLQLAEHYVSIGNFEKAESIFVEVWWTTSKEYRIRRSGEWELKNIKAVLSYCGYLISWKKETTAAVSVLLSFWEEHKHTMSSSQTILNHLVEVGKLMESARLSWMAVGVFQHCAQYLNTQSALYKEVQSHIQKGYETIFEQEDTMIESVLEEIVMEWSTTNKLWITANSRLKDTYLSQSRWYEASITLVRALKHAWPGFLTLPIFDIALPQHNADPSINLAELLRKCYRYRHLTNEEENISLRLYYALRRDRTVGDRWLDHITIQLIEFYEQRGRTEKLIPILQTMVTDYSQRFGEDHPTVLKWLLRLAEITRPSPVSIGYYRRIVRIINKDSKTCHPDAFEPLVIVAKELVNQGCYSDAIEYFEVLFNSLQHSHINPKLRDHEFLDFVYERYVSCLHMVNASIEIIHDVTVHFRETCVAVFGAAAAISVQATKKLAYICRESKKYEEEAIDYYNELLGISSDQIPIYYDEIHAILDAIHQGQYESISDFESGKEIQRSITIRKQRLSRSWSRKKISHTEISSLVNELVSLHLKEKNTQAAVSLLQESIVNILSTGTSATALPAISRDFASCYIASGLFEQASSLSEDIYHQIVFGESQNTQLQKLDFASSWNSAMIFLAQFEYILLEREGLSLTVEEIHSTLAAEYLLFQQFASEVSSETSTMLSVIGTASRLHYTLSYRARWATVSHLLERCANYFQIKEGKKAQLTYSESKLLIDTLLKHFSTHTSQDFLRSTAIATYNRVNELLGSGEYRSACDLAQISFKYIWSQGRFNLVIVKVLFQLGIAVSGRNLQPQPETAVKENMVKVSSTIIKELLGYCAVNNIDLSKLDIPSINTIIGVLDEMKDYHTLASLLTALWDNRERYGPSQLEQAYTLALGRRLVITRYHIGEDVGALRLAEDLAYNCARVHGPRHPSTIEMTVLLSQIYTSVGQDHQKSKARRELATRYYRKAATLHENALRAFLDPHPTLPMETVEWSSPESSGSNSPQPGHEGESVGSHVRRHLHLLKLATERLGNWSKDYSEYEKLNSDLFKTFANDLAGVEGVEKWKINNFGNGRAEANDDLVFCGSQKAMDLDMRLPIAV